LATWLIFLPRWYASRDQRVFEGLSIIEVIRRHMFREGARHVWAAERWREEKHGVGAIHARAVRPSIAPGE
jgi:hypothetical protein